MKYLLRIIFFQEEEEATQKKQKQKKKLPIWGQNVCNKLEN